MHNSDESRKIHTAFREITVICPICLTNNPGTHSINKALYTKCRKCHTIYTTDIICPLTENDQSEDRNTVEMNFIRFDRANNLYPSFTNALDFGCGYGNFVSFLRLNKIQADGVDKTTELTIDSLKSEYYHVIFMVEVIEHLIDPRTIIKQLACSLTPDGLIYIETTFSDNIKCIDSCSYVNPDIGHRTIMSIKALKKCLPKDMKFYQKINDNVVILQKK